MSEEAEFEKSEAIARWFADQRGDGSASGSEPFDAVYDELRRLAGQAMRQQRPGHTLQATALVHEAWLKVAPHLDRLQDRPHFLALAARAMRQILRDHARKRGALRRGEAAVRHDISLLEPAVVTAEVDSVVLDDLLEQLTILNERHGRVAELRILGGMTADEIAEVEGVSSRTIESDWRFARAWMRTRLDHD